LEFRGVNTKTLMERQHKDSHGALIDPDKPEACNFASTMSSLAPTRVRPIQAVLDAKSPLLRTVHSYRGCYRRPRRLAVQHLRARPVLAAELDPPARVRVSRRIVRRLGAIVLTSLAVLVVTGVFNVLLIGGVSILLAIKLMLVVVVIGLALYQYGNLGTQIWRLSAVGPSPEVADLQVRFRRIGLTVGSIVLLIVYLSIGLTRGSGAIVASIR